jgi:hypothetical protein
VGRQIAAAVLAVVVELPPGTPQPTAVTRYADAVLAIAREVVARPARRAE